MPPRPEIRLLRRAKTATSQLRTPLSNQSISASASRDAGVKANKDVMILSPRQVR